MYVHGPRLDVEAQLRDAVREEAKGLKSVACVTLMLLAGSKRGSARLSAMLEDSKTRRTEDVVKSCARAREMVRALDWRVQVTDDAKSAVESAVSAASSAANRGGEFGRVVQVAGEEQGEAQLMAERAVKSRCEEVFGKAQQESVQRGVETLLRRCGINTGCSAAHSAWWNVASFPLLATEGSCAWAAKWGALVGEAEVCGGAATEKARAEWFGSVWENGAWRAVAVSGGSATSVSGWRGRIENDSAWFAATGSVGEWLRREGNGSEVPWSEVPWSEVPWYEVRIRCVGEPKLFYEPSGNGVLWIENGEVWTEGQVIVELQSWNVPDESAWPVPLMREEQN